MRATPPRSVSRLELGPLIGSSSAGPFVDRAGVAWLRLGECSDCGECCQGCPLHRPELARKCGDYGGELYLEQRCDEWPTHPSQVGPGTIKPSCSYRFVEVTCGD